MWTNIGKKAVKVASAAANSVRLDSGIGSAQVKKVEIIRRHEKMAEILSKVRHRDGLPQVSSHIEHLVGRVSSVEKDMPSLDLSDKTELILQSSHPVRHVVERYRKFHK